MCRRLRCHIPHHVQTFFDHLHEYLRRTKRSVASLDDVERVYTDDMLSVRGQVDLQHYETRMRLVLGTQEYRTALELLTEAVLSDGMLSDSTVNQYRESTITVDASNYPATVDDVLYLLEHDGYLERCVGGYRFVSGLLEDWWRARHGRHFVPIIRRGPSTER